MGVVTPKCARLMIDGGSRRKMFWNYRVVRYRGHTGDEAFRVEEVYYGKDGEPSGRCDAQPMGETLEDVRKDLKWMTEALERPVLEIEAEGENCHG